MMSHLNQRNTKQVRDLLFPFTGVVRAASSEPDESTTNRVEDARDFTAEFPADDFRRTELVAFGRPKFATIAVKLSSLGRG